ncbi:MAG: response regulator [Candidatus Kapabacteria bacterium]|jgi:DNA-binding NtrC family response regulator|nr:response regulator [Candidatus Kapabacteria bacterium]
MSKIKVLLVDDEEELVFTLSERLQFRGFDTDAALNSVDALRLASINDYDVAVIDLKLPLVTGQDLMKMIKHIQPDLKIIFMTGHCSDDQGRKGIGKGYFDCLIKPIKIDILFESIIAAVLSYPEKK